MEQQNNSSFQMDDVEKTVAINSSQLTASGTTGTLHLHSGVSPEAVVRVPWKIRLRNWWLRFIRHELRDVDAVIDSPLDRNLRSINFAMLPPQNVFELDALYVLGDRFSGGGQSSLHYAVDRRFGRTVAIKTLTRKAGEDFDSAKKAFIREAQITSQLDHPSILPVYSLTTDAEGGLHLAMKYIAGRTLQKYLQFVISMYTRNGMDAYDERKNLFRRIDFWLRVCDAMEYAHSRNVLHCDLKPGNIMIGRCREVYVMDWGIARPVEDGKPWVPSSKITGTLRYLAPEIIQKKRPGVRSDIFSLGTILYEIITLNNAFAGQNSREIMQRLKRGNIGRFRHRFGFWLSRDLKAIIQKATHPDPIKRYISVRDLSADVRRILRNEAVSARPDSLFSKFVRWCAHHPRSIASIFLLIFVVSVISLSFSMEREVDNMVMQRAEYAAVSVAYSRSALTAQDINARMVRQVQILESVTSEFLLLQSAMPDALGHDRVRSQAEMNSAGAPASLKPSGFYCRPVDFLHLTYTTVPEMSGFDALTPLQQKNMRVLNLMVPRFLHIVFRSKSGMPDETLESVEKSVREQGTSPYFLVFGFPDGLFSIYPGTVKIRPGFDPRLRRWYQNAANVWNLQHIWCRPFLGSYEESGYRIACSTPIYSNNGVFIGAAAVELNLDYLAKTVAQLGNTGPEVCEKCIFDREGFEILKVGGSQTLIPGRSRLRSSVVEMARHRKYGTYTENMDGKEYLWCFFYLQSSHWYYAERIDLELLKKR